MASLLRAVPRVGGQIFRSCVSRHQLTPQHVCRISTSKSNKDTAVVSEAKNPVQETTTQDDDNFISYGFSWYDKEADRFMHHTTLFFGFVVALCWGGFVYAYQPDHKMRDWCQREAYLEIARREKEGLPLVSPNIVDPSKIDLPSDEELQGMEIIV